MAQLESWQQMSTREVFQRLHSNPTSGLSVKEAKRRLSKSSNEGVWNLKQKGYQKRFGRLMTDIISVAMLLSVLIAFGLDQMTHGIAILLILLCGTGLRFFMYYLSKKQFNEAVKRVLPRVRVVREGTVKRIGFNHVVPGDLVLLDAGDMVPCDLRILRAEHVTVDESVLHFSPRAEKREGRLPETTPEGEQSNRLFASTTVLSGSALGIATETGHATYVSRTFDGIAWSVGESVPSLERFERYSTYLSLGALLLVVVITFIGMMNTSLERSALQVFINALAFCLSVSGECLTIAGRMSLALAIQESAKAKTNIKDPSLVEKIGEADCVVLDGTRLLKSGKTAICAYFSNGEMKEDISEPTGKRDKSLSLLLEKAYITTGELPETVSEKEQKISEESETLRSLYRRYAEPVQVRKAAGRTLLDTLPSTEPLARGLSGAIVSAGNACEAIFSGPVDLLLDYCSSIQAEGRKIGLNERNRAVVLQCLRRYEMRAESIVGVAVRPSPITNLKRPSVVRQELCFLGFMVLSDSVPESIVQSIQEFRKKQVPFVLFSDGSEKDRWFASEAGLLTDRDWLITSEQPVTAVHSLRRGQCAVVEVPTSENSSLKKKETLQSLRHAGYSAALLGESTSAWIPEETDVVMAVAPKSAEEMTKPQTLGMVSDAIISRGYTEGSIASALRTIVACRNATVNQWHVWRYLFASAVAKGVLMLLGVISLFPMLGSVPLLLWGLVLDAIASLAIVYNGAPSYILRLNLRQLRMASLSKQLFPVLMGILWSVFSMAVPILQGLPTQSSIAQVWLALCLCLLAVLAEMMQEESMFRSKSRLSYVLLILAALVSLMASLLLLNSGAASLIDGAVLSGAEALFAFLPAIILILVTEIYKRLTNNH